MGASACYLFPARWYQTGSVLALLTVVFLTACPKQVPPPLPVAAPEPPAEVKPAAVPLVPGLVVHVEPDDAELIIDGTNYGVASKLELQQGVLPLHTGIYQVALKRLGYVSWRAEVTVNDKPETLQVTLIKQPAH
jgi:hypothetical protein